MYMCLSRSLRSLFLSINSCLQVASRVDSQLAQMIGWQDQVDWHQRMLTLHWWVLFCYTIVCCASWLQKKSQRAMILLETFHDLAPELALLLPFFPWDLIQQENPWWSDWNWFIVSSSQKQMLVQSQRTKSTGGSGCLSDKVLPFR